VAGDPIELDKVMYLSRSEFERFCAQGFNQIPLIDRVPLGGLTPSALLATLGDARDRILLESTRVSPEDGRYSIVVMDSFEKFTAKGRTYTRNGRTHDGDPIEALRALMRRWKGYRPPATPLFCGGAIGYFAYECNRYFEDLPLHARDDLAIPDIYLILTNTLVVFDHVEAELLLIASGRDYDACLERLRKLAAIVDEARAYRERAVPVGVDTVLANFSANFSREDYEAAVARVQEYIRAGDVYQVNLSQKLEVPIETAGIALYQTLSQLSPVHFASYLDLDGFEIVSASPERLVRLEKGRLFTRPIAGTRRRGSEEEDERFIHELKTDEKEVSEHAMLIDLERNDLGRVSSFGSVRIEKLMEIVKYAHVIHIESEIVGDLSDGKDFVDVIGAMFPGGTITGMPKIRTMEIIAELEPDARTIYTGSVGYISFAGEMDLNIVIRTILVKDKKAHVNVGGGVVWDSIPSQEYKETLNKARSQLMALRPYECSHAHDDR
jgi:para-aminobenzoate synthetase component I